MYLQEELHETKGKNMKLAIRMCLFMCVFCITSMHERVQKSRENMYMPQWGTLFTDVRLHLKTRI